MASIVYSQAFYLIVEETRLVGRDFVPDESLLTVKNLFAFVSVDPFVWTKGTNFQFLFLKILPIGFFNWTRQISLTSQSLIYRPLHCSTLQHRAGLGKLCCKMLLSTQTKLSK